MQLKTFSKFTISKYINLTKFLFITLFPNNIFLCYFLEWHMVLSGSMPLFLHTKYNHRIEAGFALPQN